MVYRYNTHVIYGEKILWNWRIEMKFICQMSKNKRNINIVCNNHNHLQFNNGEIAIDKKEQISN